jgi:hypothetical protein
MPFHGITEYLRSNRPARRPWPRRPAWSRRSPTRSRMPTTPAKSGSRTTRTQERDHRDCRDRRRHPQGPAMASTFTMCHKVSWPSRQFQGTTTTKEVADSDGQYHRATGGGASTYPESSWNLRRHVPRSHFARHRQPHESYEHPAGRD